MGRVIIIGTGPAGVSAALYTARAGVDTIMIGGGDSALNKTDEIENYYGFPEPVSGLELLERGEKQAERLGVKILHEEVVGLGFEEKLKVITDKDSYDADSIVIATGSPRNVPKTEGLSDFEGSGVSYCAVCDAFFNRGKNVAVLGNGQYALNEVHDLLSVAASVTVLTDGMRPEAEFPENVFVRTEKIKRFAGESRIEKVVFEDDTQIDIFSVFIAYGTAGSADLSRKLGIFTEGSRIKVDESMATNVPGVFAAGDCIGGMLQIAAAVYEGATAGTSAVKYIRGL